ncbi:hypothetical protein DERP_007681 [Dermatophagoides pteronyssinus]|uniref:Uncharacterized protein n=1 Tax=Dermatophagoides pteronyssinus TaxID=6956 RepID=A0ABQ8JKW3_DERPT|nr:hypothetical protein DERP_007681 [Dermatophagoides pteronyssinus]
MTDTSVVDMGAFVELNGDDLSVLKLWTKLLFRSIHLSTNAMIFFSWKFIQTNSYESDINFVIIQI